MKIIVKQHVQLKNLSDGHSAIAKEFNSGIKPSKGDEYYDSLFEGSEGKEIKGITIDYQENACYVRLESQIIPSKSQEDLQAYLDLAKRHGWKIIQK